MESWNISGNNSFAKSSLYQLLQTKGDVVMGKIDRLLLVVSLGFFAVTNFVVCIFTVSPGVILTANLLVGIICLGTVLFVQSVVSGISRGFKITKRQARNLLEGYFDYYKNVKKITLDEYLEERS